ncbi:MAG TPA: hypothetical protein VI078_02610 [bacterium]
MNITASALVLWLIAALLLLLVWMTVTGRLGSSRSLAGEPPPG